MLTKKLLFGGVFVAGLLIAFLATPLAYDNGGQACDPAGLWFGFPLGNPPFKVVTAIPLDGGQKRYSLVADDQDAGVTPFHGEMVRIKKNIYQVWGVQCLLMGEGDFDYYVISGEWIMSDCDTAVGNYLLSYYMEDPFHDDTVNPLWSLPIVNEYDRMPMIDNSSDF
jgi:hypothetical protein